jgi:hypothetical protein
MTNYLVISRHTPEQCLQSLDTISSRPNAKEDLPKWEWGCNSGEHTGYLTVSAANEAEALRHVPDNLRAQARAVKVEKYTVEQIRSFHTVKK